MYAGAGAELASVVRRATAWALDEMLNKKDLSQQAKDFHPVVEMRHFRNVIDNEIKPAYGAAHEAISSLFSEGIWPFGARYERVVQVVHDACHVTEDVPKMTVLLEGVCFSVHAHTLQQCIHTALHIFVEDQTCVVVRML